MNARLRVWLTGCLTGLFLIVPATLRAQDTLTAEVLAPLPNGLFSVVIGADTMLAMPVEVARNALKALADVEALRQEVAAESSLIASYEVAIARHDTMRSLQARYIAELDSLYRGYRNVAEGYKRLSGEPWVTFQAGLGATGPDKDPAVMVGVGIRRIRIWGFFQEGNAGALLGVNLRVF